MDDDCPPDRVASSELLYRWVVDDARLFPFVAGQLRISGQVFNDSRFRPSVNRACVHGNEPRLTQRTLQDGVLQVKASVIRSCSDSRRDAKGRPIYESTHRFDVEPQPLLENPAHAEIFLVPVFVGNPGESGLFRRLIEALARHSETAWAIKPASIRNQERQ